MKKYNTSKLLGNGLYQNEAIFLKRLNKYCKHRYKKNDDTYSNYDFVKEDDNRVRIELKNVGINPMKYNHLVLTTSKIISFDLDLLDNEDHKYNIIWIYKYKVNKSYRYSYFYYEYKQRDFNKWKRISIYNQDCYTIPKTDVIKFKKLKDVFDFITEKNDSGLDYTIKHTTS